MTIEEKISEIEERLKVESEILAVWDNELAFHNRCCDFIKSEGLWLEFGVYTGRSICQLAARTKEVVYGFDSFEGLPEHWNFENPKGHFNLNGQIPLGAVTGPENGSTLTCPWPDNVTLIKGWFEETLPSFLEKHTQNCALVHIDSDIYSSAKTVLNYLEDRIVEGTIIIFDEINDYPDYKEHEIKAFAEFLLKTGKNYKPLVYQNLGYNQGCFLITK